MAKPRTLSIGELASRTGLAASALRYYEAEGLLPAVPRAQGRRRYDAQLVRQVDVLLFARRAGLGLRELKALLSPADRSAPLGARWQAIAQHKLAELDQAESALQRRRSALLKALGCGCQKVEECTLSPDDTVGVGEAAGCCTRTAVG